VLAVCGIRMRMLTYAYADVCYADVSDMQTGVCGRRLQRAEYVCYADVCYAMMTYAMLTYAMLTYAYACGGMRQALAACGIRMLC